MPLPPPLPPIADQPLSVVLLARQAADHAEASVAGWLDALNKRGKEFELIVVDDASSDGTADRLEALPDRSRLTVLRLDVPRGEGAALKAGLERARHPLVFYTLCAGEYRPEHLAALLDRAMPDGKGFEIDHLHLLSGYRAGTRVPLWWRIPEAIWRGLCFVILSYFPPASPGWLGGKRNLGWLAARILFGLRSGDVSCPCRLFRREILRRIPLQSKGTLAHVELLAKANFLGHLIGEEVPLDIKPGPYRGDWGRMWREARRLFNWPDFGPATLPEAPTPG